LGILILFIFENNFKFIGLNQVSISNHYNKYEYDEVVFNAANLRERKAPKG
jgi:hypothetical protein